MFSSAQVRPKRTHELTEAGREKEDRRGQWREVQDWQRKKEEGYRNPGFFTQMMLHLSYSGFVIMALSGFAPS